MPESAAAARESAAVFGLGKVGLPLAVAIASRDVPVIGFDRDPGRRALVDGNPVGRPELRRERHLAEAWAATRGSLTLASDVAEAVARSTISFVIVPTPSKDDGSFCLDQVSALLAEIGRALPRAAPGHLIVVLSTVSPGSVDILLRTVERASGMTRHRDFSLCYAPPLIALGDVVAGFLKPDFAFVGETDPDGGERLARFYRRVLAPGTPIHRMSAQSVEIAKLSLNNFLTFKIAFANLIGHLCERRAGASAADILAALGQDKRVGPLFLSAGMGFGGPCLPRDNAALAAALREAGLPTAVPDAISAANADHARLLAQCAGPAAGRHFAVVGLGYKQGSIVTTGSSAIALCNAFAAAGAIVRAYDPLAEYMDLSDLSPAVSVSAIPDADLARQEVVVVTGRGPVYLPFLGAIGPEARLFDMVGALEDMAAGDGHRFGTGPAAVPQ